MGEIIHVYLRVRSVDFRGEPKISRFKVSRSYEHHHTKNRPLYVDGSMCANPSVVPLRVEQIFSAVLPLRILNPVLPSSPSLPSFIVARSPGNRLPGHQRKVRCVSFSLFADPVEQHARQLLRRVVHDAVEYLGA